MGRSHHTKCPARPETPAQPFLVTVLALGSRLPCTCGSNVQSTHCAQTRSPALMFNPHHLKDTKSQGHQKPAAREREYLPVATWPATPPVAARLV